MVAFAAMGMKTGLAILGSAFGIVAAVLLYYGSLETPWEIRTWDGVSAQEKGLKRKRRRFGKSGFLFLGIGFMCQLIAALL